MRGWLTGSGTGEITSDNIQQPRREATVGNIQGLFPDSLEARILNVPNTEQWKIFEVTRHANHSDPIIAHYVHVLKYLAPQHQHI